MGCNTLAIDIGGSKIVFAVVSQNGEIVHKLSPVAAAGIDARGLTELAAQKAEELSRYEPRVCGVSVPGLADPVKGMWIYAPFSGISDFPVASAFCRATGLPVFIENDVNACAIAEKRFGCMKDTDDFIWITVSNGIGGAVFCGGRLYRGGTGNAGEIGHIKVEFENPAPCGCGGYGCLEAHASGTGISGDYYKRTKKTKSAADIALLADAGDTTASEVFRAAGAYIGKAAAAAVNILNPSAIVFGGGVSASYGLFEPSMRKTLGEQCFNAANRDLRLMKTALGYDAGLLGASAITIKE